MIKFLNLTRIVLLIFSISFSYSDTFSQGKNADGPPVTRSEVVLTADKYARVHWTMSEKNLTGKNSDRNFRSNYPVGERTGVAYKWSGWDTVEDFLKKIEEGYGAGTGGGANTYNNFSINSVTGVSCTGLVSRAWHLNNKYTLNYANPFIRRKFKEITTDITGINFRDLNIKGLKKGDAFINQGHIILFLYEGKDGKLRVIDSSLPGVRFREISCNYLWRNGYKAIRYNNIKEIENPPGTIKNPIIISSNDIPCSLEGNTRDVVSMEFDRYSADPAISQEGPETIYRLEMSKPSKIKIHINDFKDEGIDNDIHILTSLRKNKDSQSIDCISSGDTTIIIDLEEGIFYIVVDSRDDKPGEYVLRVSYN